MAAVGRRALAAVAQLTATADVELNLQQCRRAVARAASCGAKCVFLPEASDFIADGAKEAEALSAKSGEFVRSLQGEASAHNLWIFAGVHERASEPAGASPTGESLVGSVLPKMYNAHVAIDASGSIVSHYRKVHLFDVNIPNRVRLMESESTSPGSRLEVVRDSPIGNVGLAVCYDVRFPEISLALAHRLGAEVLTYPSAFTVPTGAAHWEVLLRARAIETQSYVIAAAQIGKHNAKRESYGHAMIVDPWGTVVAQCASSGEGVAVAEIDLDYVHRIRAEMPVQQHRRHEVYSSS